MNDFFRRLHETLARQPAALATVVVTRGSTPRLAGARQFLAADGEFCGTVGGGATEARTLELARATLADGEPRVFAADLRGQPGDVREGVCGGTMTIWITRLDPALHAPVVSAIAASLRAGRRVSLSTRLDAATPLALEPVADSFLDLLEPTPRLLVVGAGHIGRSLARLAGELDFTVAVQDERPEWLSPAAFPPDCALEIDLTAAVAALRGWEGERFSALVTRGFPQDVAALHALAGVPGLAYLGLLGSRTRVATVLAAHRKSGGAAFAPDVLHAPVGLEIGAETPEEIAVSIAAEIIQVRRRGHKAAARSGGHSAKNG